jgi:hypothetical protein
MEKTYFKYNEDHNPISNTKEGSQEDETPIKHEPKH